MRNATKNWWTGSTDWKPQMAQGGLFSNVPSESPFYNANLVWVKYCSSDLWTGSADASYETYGFYFKGEEPRRAPALEEESAASFSIIVHVLE